MYLFRASSYTSVNFLTIYPDACQDYMLQLKSMKPYKGKTFSLFECVKFFNRPIVIIRHCTTTYEHETIQVQESIQTLDNFP